jgi:UDP-3-O-[3-hydroxymyristoyl] N-acetylglucosamine deacetylase
MPHEYPGRMQGEKEHLTNMSTLHKLVPSMERTSVAQEVLIEGTGLHRGGAATLVLKPGANGIAFIKEGRRIPVSPDNIVDTRLNTTIGDGVVRISTIEHLMSALYGMGITDCEIELRGDEIPVLDGSAMPFIQHLTEAGIRSLGLPLAPIQISSRLRAENGDAWIEAGPGPFSLTYEIAFPEPAIGEERYCFGGLGYEREIAPARTFGRLQDVEMMHKAGLALGGGLHNAVVVDHSIILNPEGLRFPDEFIRHKVLDALGDLWILGAPLLGEIHAFKASHALHIALVKQIAASMAGEGQV